MDAIAVAPRRERFVRAADVVVEAGPTLKADVVSFACIESVAAVLRQAVRIGLVQVYEGEALIAEAEMAFRTALRARAIAQGVVVFDALARLECLGLGAAAFDEASVARRARGDCLLQVGWALK
jgi:arginine/ornithine N-succinyltransferase beta subunit